MSKHCPTCQRESTGIREDFVHQYGCSYCRELTEESKAMIAHWENKGTEKDYIKFFDVNNIRTVLKVPFKESLVPIKGEELVLHNCDNPEDPLSLTARLDGYTVLGITRRYYNDGTTVVCVDVRSRKDD